MLSRAIRTSTFRSLPFASTRFFHATRPAMTVHIVKTADEFNSAIKNNKVVLVDCFAEWCGPCKAIAPILEKHSNSEEFKDVHFLKFDVEEIPDITAQLNIRAMPTFLIYKDGERADELVGANPGALQQLIQKHSA
ncbi:hypothetical protein VHEMI06059 [[Torrubiella] hemipterigena]|uniref:Thioredoxin domain-containing protein n=1 Tax=[Torrubiella] hemipterigena TaxID=1531966 RepID=A0A0A1TI72_9HYPO|nr:hypothetical protein VHEMI06059 [[Torrubiella] hemipterigena]